MRLAKLTHILCDVCMCNVVCNVEGLFNMQFLTFIGKSLVGRWQNKPQGVLHWMKAAVITDTLDTTTQFTGTAVNEKLAIKSATIILPDVESATILWACMRLAKIMPFLCDVCMCNVVCVEGI